VENLRDRVEREMRMENIKHDLWFLAVVLAMIAMFYLVGVHVPPIQSRVHASNNLHINCSISYDERGEIAQCDDGTVYPVNRE